MTPPANAFENFALRNRNPTITKPTTHNEPKAQRNKNPNLIDSVILPADLPFLSCSSPFGSVSDFGAFGSFADFTPTSPLSSTTKPLDLSALPPDLVVILKNIQKRDPTTRSKAVSDLPSKLPPEIDDQTLETLLAIWVPPKYRSPRLTADHTLCAAGNRL